MTILLRRVIFILFALLALPFLLVMMFVMLGMVVETGRWDWDIFWAVLPCEWPVSGVVGVPE
jgi:hypothetical protein